MEVKTWADFGALPKEELDALTPEELESLKTSITDSETQIAETRKKEAEDYTKTKELAENYKIRAEKAERESKKGGGSTIESNKGQEGLANKDILYFAKADIHEDDIDTVLEWAKFKNIGVKEAHAELKAVLSTKEEERRSAQVTQTRGARGSTAPTAQDLIAKARKGNLPEKDEDIEALAEAEMQMKLNNVRK